MLKIYSHIMSRAEPILSSLLKNRLTRGKEDEARLDERKGVAGFERPRGKLIWLHAASVGEAQSALILIHSLLNAMDDAHVLVTTGTQSSAQRMEIDLPERAFHQFVPLDHPAWVARFLDHWQPDTVLWMESELWPNMLLAIQEREIPAALINARLSKKSMMRWSLVKNSIAHLLSTFSVILAQSEQDARNFEKLGADNAISSGNIKYSAAALPYNDKDLKALQAVIGNRPTLVYASTHDGEEVMAGDIHDILDSEFPNLLSIIIPRHPERGQDISDVLQEKYHGVLMRGQDKMLPDERTRIYIADTLGEMGLFYRLSEIVYVGRSMSTDGGGGHNPLEPALLNCAVLHGKNTQNLQDIYDDMQAHNACIEADDQEALLQKFEWLLSHPGKRDDFIQRAALFAKTQSGVVDVVMAHVLPLTHERNSDAA